MSNLRYALLPALTGWVILVAAACSSSVAPAPSAQRQIWQDHLLALSMLQHPSGRWTWGRFVLLYPASNPSFARAAAAYRAVLRDGATFEARTFEELMAVPGTLSDATRAALVERYF